MRTRTLVPIAAVVLLLVGSAGASHCTTWSTSVTTDRVLVLHTENDMWDDADWIVNDLCQLPEEDPDPAAIDPEALVGSDPLGAIDPLFGGYGDDDEDGSDDGPCVYSIWIYYETNGIPGLQRLDWVVDDTCHGMISGDSWVW